MNRTRTTFENKVHPSMEIASRLHNHKNQYISTKAADAICFNVGIAGLKHVGNPLRQLCSYSAVYGLCLMKTRHTEAPRQTDIEFLLEYFICQVPPDAACSILMRLPLWCRAEWPSESFYRPVERMQLFTSASTEESTSLGVQLKTNIWCFLVNV